MRMHWILRGAAKQEAQPDPASYSREDSTFGDLATVAYVHISCNVQDTVEPHTAAGLDAKGEPMAPGQ